MTYICQPLWLGTTEDIVAKAGRWGVVKQNETERDERGSSEDSCKRVVSNDCKGTGTDDPPVMVERFCIEIIMGDLPIH